MKTELHLVWTWGGGSRWVWQCECGATRGGFVTQASALSDAHLFHADSCDTCGAVILPEDVDLHARWHETIGPLFRCPKCNGRGELVTMTNVTVVASDPRFLVDQTPCPVCNGSGTLLPKPSGRTANDFDLPAATAQAHD